MNWFFPRSLGRLSILNRASYVSIVIIPILAWLLNAPIINKTIHELELVDSKIINLSKELCEKPNMNVINGQTMVFDKYLIVELEKFKKNTCDIANSIENNDKKILERKQFPLTLSTTYFAALIIVVANMIYSVFADEIIRNYNENEYIEYCVKNYNLSRTESFFREKTEYLLENGIKFPAKGLEDDQHMWEVRIVGIHAKEQYNELLKNPVNAICITSILYIFAIILILITIYLQIKLLISVNI